MKSIDVALFFSLPPSCLLLHGPLAQLVEQLTLNQRVRSSSLRRPTIPSRRARLTVIRSVRFHLSVCFYGAVVRVSCTRLPFGLRNLSIVGHSKVPVLSPWNSSICQIRKMRNMGSGSTGTASS